MEIINSKIYVYKLNVNNYKPMVIVCTIGKILENALKTILKFMNKINIMYNKQYGFKLI